MSLFATRSMQTTVTCNILCTVCSLPNQAKLSTLFGVSHVFLGLAGDTSGFTYCSFSNYWHSSPYNFVTDYKYYCKCDVQCSYYISFWAMADFFIL